MKKMQPINITQPEKPTTSKERCILRMPEVLQRTGYKRAHIYNLIRQGKFPKGSKIGVRAVGWDSEKVQHWIDERLGQLSSD